MSGSQEADHESPFKWHVVTHPVRMSTTGQDSQNVTRIRDSSKWLIILKCIMALIKFRPDVIHCVGMSKISFGCAWAARLLQIPFIFELSIDPPENTLLDTRNKWFERPLQSSSGFIALTPRIKKLFTELNSDIPIFLRPNPVTLPANIDIRALDFNPPIHLLLGRFTLRKGQLEALNTLSLLPNSHKLILAGPILNRSDQDFVERLRKRATELNISSRVEFECRFITDVADLMQKASSIWCFSEREGLPNVVLEGLWLGRPAFVKKNLGLEHLIIDGFNGFNLSVKNEDKAAEILKTINTSDISCISISYEAKKAFNIETHAKNTYKFILNCLQMEKQP